MSRRHPVTRTSFDRDLSIGPRLFEDLFAPLETLIAQAGAPRTSIARRLRLLGTASRRVDSLFQTRASSLRVAGGGTAARARRQRLRRLLEGAHAIWEGAVLPALRERGAVIHAWPELAAAEQRALARIFVRELSPLLTPLTVDATHPFPAVASLALNVAVLARERRSGAERFIGIEIPPTVPRFIGIANSVRLLSVECLIGANLTTLLPDLEVVHHHTFRVTRDGRPLRARGLANGLASRTRPAVRLEVDAEMPPAQRALLLAGLGLDAGDLDACAPPLDLASVAAVPLARLVARGCDEATNLASGEGHARREAGGR